MFKTKNTLLVLDMVVDLGCVLAPAGEFKWLTPIC